MKENKLGIPKNEFGMDLIKIKKFNNNFKQIILSKNNKKQIERIIKEYENYDKLKELNLDPINKILLCGPSGTGKTSTVKIVSSSLNLPVLFIDYESIVSSFLGEISKNLFKILEFINSSSFLVFFDEFDSLGKARNSEGDVGEMHRVVNTVIKIMDGIENKNIVFAATNYQSVLDSAIFRRFKNIIFYDYPEQKLKLKLFKLFLMPLSYDHKKIKLDSIIKELQDISPSNIKLICDYAIKTALLDSRKELSFEDIKDSIDLFIKIGGKGRHHERN